MISIIVIVTGIVAAASAIALAWSVLHAADGYEDGSGFHYGKPPPPLQDGDPH